ncbi:MAG: dihydrofolate reductase [Cytophagaceae bacterium]
MLLSIIVAVSENNVIGKDNQLIWHLPDDLKHFKNTTLGHHIIMGRKTFESMGRVLPGRPHIIVTRNKGYKVEGCHIAHSINEAVEIARQAGESEAFITGGATLIDEYVDKVDRLYLTEVKAAFEGDVKVKPIDKSNFKILHRESHPIDEKHAYAFDILIMEKIRN